jgi:hypothetical protein
MKFLARSKWVKKHSEVGQEANKLLRWVKKKAVLSEVGQETLFVVNGR